MMSGERTREDILPRAFAFGSHLRGRAFSAAVFLTGLFLLQRPKLGNAAAATSLPALILRSLSIRSVT